jgi:plastocyanin
MRALIVTLLLAGPVLAEGGIIAGKVESTPSKYLEETVVYVKDAPAPSAPAAVDMDQKGMRFLPHILTIAVGDTVKFLNHDGVDHNVYTPDNEGYNLGMIHKDGTGDHKFDKPGSYAQLCSVHPEMLGYVFVGQNRHAAVVGKDGKFRITGVPAGTWKVAVWNPHLKAPEQTVTVAAGKTAEASFSIKR